MKGIYLERKVIKRKENHFYQPEISINLTSISVFPVSSGGLRLSEITSNWQALKMSRQTGSDIFSGGIEPSKTWNLDWKVGKANN